jgi:hypothetical protein
MAIIWSLKDKNFPARGYKEAERDIGWCVENLQLRPEQWLPKFSRAQVIGAAKLSFSDDRRHVVVEIRDDEADGWMPGYYFVEIEPQQARTAIASGADA